MDVSLVGTLGQIAGIGGISLGLILFVFRDIIRKNIFPKFTDEVLAYRLLRLLAVLAWSAAIFGVGAWVTTNLLTDTESLRIGSDDYQIENTQNIVNQFQQVVGRPLDDEALLGRIERAVELATSGRFQEASAMFQEIAEGADVPAVHNNLGALLAAQGDTKGARTAFERAAQVDPDYQKAHFNLAVLAERDGRLDDALREFEQAPDVAEARAAAEEIEEQNEAGTFTREVEPNADTFTATMISTDSDVQGSIQDGADEDYFIFTTPPTHRDFIEISLENRSTTLEPRLHLFNSDKTNIFSGSQFGVTPGTNLRHPFVSGPDEMLYLSVSTVGGTGAYVLRVTPSHSYDSFEPNNDVLNPTPILLDQVVEAAIMDAGDQDYYQFRTSRGGEVAISLENRATTLGPRLHLFDSDKTNIFSSSQFGVTPGTNLPYSFTADPDATYFVNVTTVGGAGEYRLTVTEQ